MNLEKLGVDIKNELVKIIKDSTEIMFHNFYVTLMTCNMNYELCGMPIWKHCYHTLYSCDKWFAGPMEFIEPSFHEDGLDSLDCIGDKVLSREDLLKYYECVSKKTLDYLKSLSDEDLYTKPKGHKYIRLECMIGQMRHFYTHLGNINATTIIETDKWPMVVGMSAFENGFDKEKLYE